MKWLLIIMVLGGSDMDTTVSSVQYDTMQDCMIAQKSKRARFAKEDGPPKMVFCVTDLEE